MKGQIVRTSRVWVVSAVLLVGLVYSLLALNITPVYASSCDCDQDDLVAATQACIHMGAAWRFDNWACPNVYGEVEFWCLDGSNTVQGPFFIPCQ
jgi:hypothetical protein